MHLALGGKARFIAPILTTFKMTNFSNVIRAKELRKGGGMLYSLGLLSCQYFSKDNKLVRIPLQEFVALLPSRVQ